MPIITFASTKGGSTKTTSAITLAITISKLNPDLVITLIDCDPEAYLADWFENSKANGLLPANMRLVRETQDAHIADAIHDADNDSDIVIVDPEGKATMLLRDAICLSDLTLIPLQPSPMDARAIPKIVEVIDRAARSKKHRVEVDYIALFTRTRPGNALTAEHRAIVEGCLENGVPMLSTQLLEREVFKGYLSVGGTLDSRLEASKKRLEAAREKQSVWADENIERLAGRLPELDDVAKAELAELKKQNRKVVSKEKSLIEQLEAAIDNSLAVTNEVLGELEKAMVKKDAA